MHQWLRSTILMRKRVARFERLCFQLEIGIFDRLLYKVGGRGDRGTIGRSHYFVVM